MNQADPADRRVQRESCPACESRSVSQYRNAEQDGKAFSLSKCHACGLIFVTDPREPELNRDQNPQPVSSDRPVRPRPGQRYFALALERVFRQMDRPIRVADVGGGRGELISILRTALSDSVDVAFQLVEPDPVYAATAKAWDIPVRLNTLDEFCDDPANRNAWDVVLLDNVLEHLIEPGKAVAAVRETLKPGGLVAIAVPNVLDVRRFLWWGPGKPLIRWLSKGRGYQLWIPAVHINYFSADSLRQMLASNCMSVEYLQAPTDHLGLIQGLLWSGKHWMEKWFDYPPRGIYFLARQK